jgi:uncharacterized metal-binding protein
VKKLVRIALSGRKIIAIDGCPLACCKACLNNGSVNSELHVELTTFGVIKKQYRDFDKRQADRILKLIKLFFT